MRVVLSFSVPGVRYTSIELEATTSLTHSGDVDVTEHPLETGSNVADGARAKQPALQVEAILTDFSLDSTAKDTGDGSARDKYAALRFVRDAGGVVSITTPQESYDNMLIKQLSSPESAQMGRSVKFSLQLVQVKVVRSQTVALKKVATPKAQPKQTDGPKQPGKTSDQNVRRSPWKAAVSKGDAAKGTTDGLLSGLVLGGGL